MPDPSSVSPSEREIEAVAREMGGASWPLFLHQARDAIQAVDRVRDARGSEMQGEHHEASIRVCARGPQDDDAEKMDALSRYLEKYPPSGFAERYSADGWRHIARGVLSAASIFFPARSPQDEDHEAARLREERDHALDDIEMLRAVNARLVKDLDQARIDAACVGEMADQAEAEVRRLSSRQGE